jgi:hypothetical protein
MSTTTTSAAYDNTDTEAVVYKYRASAVYVVGQDQYDINYINFKSIVIDHDYRNNNMPLIYAVLRISSKIVDIIVSNKDTGVFILNIQKCVASDESELWKDYIKDTFIYYTPDDINKTDTRDYAESNEERADIYKEITVGLLSQSLVNTNKKVVNGIINTDMMSAAYYILSSRPVIIEPFTNNPTLKNVFLPPLNSVAKCIEYLNNYKVFYNSDYIYYMDFDTSYLLSSNGKAIPKKGDTINSVIITLKNDSDMTSRGQGMVEDENAKCYKIDISASSAQISDNEVNTKSFTSISYTSTDGTNNKSEVESLASDSNVVAKVKNVRVPNNNTGLISNISKSIVNNSIFLSINKNDLDASVFTPNKEYNISADAVYTDGGYSGKYLLIRKRELYFKSTGSGADEQFTMSTLLFFSKIVK